MDDTHVATDEKSCDSRASTTPSTSTANALFLLNKLRNDEYYADYKRTEMFQSIYMALFFDILPHTPINRCLFELSP